MGNPSGTLNPRSVSGTRGNGPDRWSARLPSGLLYVAVSAAVIAGKAPWRLVVLVSYPYWAVKRPDTGTSGIHLGSPDLYRGFGNSINVPFAAV